MADLLLTPLDVATARIGGSRLVETVFALRELRAPTTWIHAGWRKEVDSRARSLSLPLLTAMVPRAGCCADLLTPVSATQATTWADEIEAVRALPDQAVVDDIASLVANPAVSAGEADRLRAASADPRGTIEQAADELDRAWRALVEPWWPRIERVLKADVAYRSTQVAEGGLRGFVESFDRFKMNDGSLLVRGCSPAARYEGGRGLVLTPSVFASSRTFVSLKPSITPMIIYPARGLGNVWDTGAASEALAPLETLLGTTRARILSMLQVAQTTSEVADLAQIAPSTASEHLRVLRDAGLVSASSAGRSVLYQTTDKGRHLLTV